MYKTETVKFAMAKKMCLEAENEQRTRIADHWLQLSTYYLPGAPHRHRNPLQVRKQSVLQSGAWSFTGDENPERVSAGFPTGRN